jgi:endonuclease/exonuclease/phosphatase (EEP) superfamily protein YafD
MVSDLVALQRIVEQVASKQEQISQDVATLQATEQTISGKISSLTQPRPFASCSKETSQSLCARKPQNNRLAGLISEDRACSKPGAHRRSAEQRVPRIG